MRKTFFATALASSILVVASFASAQADAPGLHPFYRHALSDLRYARSLISHGTASRRANVNEARAVNSIDHALADIKAAGADDGKSMQSSVPIDPGFDENGRLHKALEALRRAREDADKEEQNSTAIALQHRATVHIDYALNYDKHAITDLGGTP